MHPKPGHPEDLLLLPEGADLFGDLGPNRSVRAQIPEHPEGADLFGDLGPNRSVRAQILEHLEGADLFGDLGPNRFVRAQIPEHPKLSGHRSGAPDFPCSPETSWDAARQLLETPGDAPGAQKTTRLDRKIPGHP